MHVGMEESDNFRAGSESPCDYFRDNEDRYEKHNKEDKVEQRAGENDDEEGQEGGRNNQSQRRSLRPQKTERKSLVENNDESENEVDSDAEDFHQTCIANALPALKQYFLNRLEQTILFLGGQSDMLKGWKIRLHY